MGSEMCIRDSFNRGELFIFVINLETLLQRRLSGSEINQFHFEEEGSIGWDHSWDSLRSVSVVRGASDDGFLSLFELADSFIPSSNDLASTYFEFKRLSSVIA